MSRRGTSLNNLSGTAVSREIDSKYDVIKLVSGHLVAIEAVATEDLAALTAALNEAKDFTGITVVVGETAGWDPVTKVLTVTSEKGDKGDEGERGTDGVNNYIHVRYSTNVGGTNMDVQPGGKTYIGINVSGDPTGSSNPNDYQWIRYVGRDGVDGVDGVDGLDGASGLNGRHGKVPVIEFSMDSDGNLLYEVVDYEDGPTFEFDLFEDEEW